jgi:hypothetical protein
MNKDDTSGAQKPKRKKAYKQKVSESSIEAPVSKNRLQLFKRRPSLISLVIFILVVLLLVLWGVNVNSQNHKVTAKDNTKIGNLLKNFDCSSKAMESVASEQPNPKAADTSIALLNYRSSCDVKNQQYTKAVAVLRQEKTYCELAKDTACANDMQIFINNISSYIEVHKNNPAASTGQGTTK